MKFQVIENNTVVHTINTTLPVNCIHEIHVGDVHTLQIDYTVRNHLVGLVVHAPRIANHDAKKVTMRTLRDISKRFLDAQSNCRLQLDKATWRFADVIRNELVDVPGSRIIKAEPAEIFDIVIDTCITIRYTMESLQDPQLLAEMIFDTLRTKRAVRAWN